MDKSYQNKAIIFMNVKVAQWSHGGHFGVSSCLDSFKAQGGRIFILNDKDSTLDEDAHELVGLEDFVKETSNVRLLLVRGMRDAHNDQSRRCRFIDDQIASIIEVMNHSALFDNDIESSYAKSEKLYAAVEDLKRQSIEKPTTPEVTAMQPIPHYHNYYRHCQSHWEETTDSMHNDRCPDCNKEITPYESVNIDADDGPRLNVIFFGVKVAQWTYPSAETARALNKLQEQGSYIFTVGDQGMSAEDSQREWDRLRNLMAGYRARGRTQDHWVVVFADANDPESGFRKTVQSIEGTAVNFLYHVLPPQQGKCTYLYEGQIPAFADRPVYLYHALVQFAGDLLQPPQLQQEENTTMENVTTRNQLVQLFAQASAILTSSPKNTSVFDPRKIAQELSAAVENPKLFGFMDDDQIATAIKNTYAAMKENLMPQSQQAMALAQELTAAIVKLRNYHTVSSNQQQKDITMNNETQTVNLAQMVTAVRDAINLITDHKTTTEDERKLADVLLHVEAHLKLADRKLATIKTTNVITINCDIAVVMGQCHDLTVEQMLSEIKHRGGNIFEINSGHQNLDQLKETMDALKEHFNARDPDSNYLIITAPHDEAEIKESGIIENMNLARQWLQDVIAYNNAQAVYVNLPTSDITGGVQELREISPGLMGLLLPITVDVATPDDLPTKEEDPIVAAITSLSHTLANRFDALTDVITQSLAKPAGTVTDTPVWGEWPKASSSNFGTQERSSYTSNLPGFGAPGSYDPSFGYQRPYGAQQNSGYNKQPDPAGFDGTIFVHIEDTATFQKLCKVTNDLQSLRAAYPNANWRFVDHINSNDPLRMRTTIENARGEAIPYDHAKVIDVVVFSPNMGPLTMSTPVLNEKMATLVNILQRRGSAVAFLPCDNSLFVSPNIRQRLDLSVQAKMQARQNRW